jgi:hypothetical protein
MILHLLTRANAQARILGKDADYVAFTRAVRIDKYLYLSLFFPK